MPPVAQNWMRGRSIELFVESYSNSARTVQVRGFNESGAIIGDHTTNADRSLATSVIPITELPSHLTVRTAETSVKRGECYVKVSVRVEGVIVALLAAGYVTDAGTIAYPNGKIENSLDGPGLIRSFTGTDPAPGAEILEAVPTGARWKFTSMISSLTTDATVISRFPILEIRNGATILQRVATQTVQPASAFILWSWSEIGTIVPLSGFAMSMMTPQNIKLPAGFVIATTTQSIQAGDNWTAPEIQIEEWISP